MKQARWRKQNLPVSEIIERRVRNKNKAYNHWRWKWTSQQLERFCVEASFRFGEEPNYVYNFRPDDEIKRDITAWRKGLREWCLKVGAANNVTEAAQFRKYYSYWYSWMKKSDG